VITPLNDFPFSLHRVDPDVQTVIVAGTGHWLHMEKPDELNRHLDEFLARVTSEA
jgi:pimeloyl-ACP methyl ester carboxylesterase